MKAKFAGLRIIAVFLSILILDFAAFYCFPIGNWPSLPYRLNLLSGFAVGQLSLIGIWLAMRSQHDLWSLLVPAIGMAAASDLRLKIGFFPDFTMLDYVCRNALQALVSLVVLWPLVRTPLWRWVARETEGQRFRYSMGHILVWTTSVAVLGMLLRQATWQGGSPLALTQWMGLLAPGVLAVSIVLAHQLPMHWSLLVILQVALGACAGYLLAWVGNKPYLSALLTAEFATQAAVMTFGLGLGRFDQTDRDPLPPPD